MSLFGDIAGASLGLANTAYNIYTNKRDFDYQKALQQQMFEREDTAVQRRMADLQAAGINPNLAAGSAASAGAVVGRSSTNDVNMGSALDMIQAANTIKQQKQAVKNAEEEGEILKYKKNQETYQDTLSKMELFSYLGLPYAIDLDINKKGGLQTNFTFFGDQSKAYSDTMPFTNLFNYNYQNQKNSADLLQKDVDWYTADKISGMALGALGLGNSFKSWKSLFSK